VGEPSIRSQRSPHFHDAMTTIRDARTVITVTKLKILHPWVRVGVVVFRNDSIGIDRRGDPLRVDRDVVVTGIVPEGDGPLVAFRPYAEHARYG
jgi:hypothetical protein